MKKIFNWVKDWIETKYKIWRFHRKYGKYKRGPITEEEYENFVLDTDIAEKINRRRTINVRWYTQEECEQLGCLKFPFIIKQK